MRGSVQLLVRQERMLSEKSIKAKFAEILFYAVG